MLHLLLSDQKIALGFVEHRRLFRLGLGSEIWMKK